MNPSLSFAKPAPIEMDEQELKDAVRVIGNWIGQQIEQANLPIQKFPSFARINGDSIRVRWIDPSAGGFIERIFTPPKGCNLDAALRIIRHCLTAAKG